MNRESSSGRRIAEELWGDLRYGFRMLISNPGFTFVSVAILSLAIGANTLLFTFFHAYVAKPLPMKNPERNVELAAREVNGRQHDHWSYTDFLQLRAQNQALEEMYASSSQELLIRDPSPRKVDGVLVSGNFFRIFSPRMILGRAFGPEEGEVPGRDAVVVLSHQAWRRIFSADPKVAGKRIRIGQANFTIIGVTDPEFNGNTPFTTPDLWVPVVMREQLIPEGGGTQLSTRVPLYRLADPENGFLQVAGLLKPGESSAQAQDSMFRTILGLNAQHPPAVAINKISLTPRRTYIPLNAEVMTAIVCFFTAFALILLIACANLAGVLLARGAARQREMAIRAAVGASRGRLTRQLLTESVLLCAVAAVPGLLLTLAGTGAIQQYLFTMLTKMGFHSQPLSPDWRVFVYTTVLALGAGILLGLAPALEATRPNVAGSIKDAGAGACPRSRPRRIREFLVIGQVAASLVLLVIAGIFLRSAQRVSRVDPGFDLDHVIDVRAEGAKDKLIARLREDPRFETASEAYRLPIGAHGLFHLPALVDGRTRPLGYNYVDSEYLETVGLPVRRGRGFTAQEARAEAQVVVVSDATARLLWPNADPIGKTVEVVGEGMGERYAAGKYNVVGVVPDVASGVFNGGPDRTAMYLPTAPGDRRNRVLLVRTRDASPATIAHLKKICAESGSVYACRPEILRETVTTLRFPFVAASGVSTVLGVLALVMTCIGLYGGVAFAVVQRTREIGVRIALGAKPGSVVRSIVGQFMLRVALGIVVGIPLCIGFSVVAGNVLYLIKTYDLTAYVGTTLFLAAVTFLAAYVPARRAAAVDPMIALRCE